MENKDIADAVDPDVAYLGRDGWSFVAVLENGGLVDLECRALSLVEGMRDPDGLFRAAGRPGFVWDEARSAVLDAAYDLGLSENDLDADALIECLGDIADEVSSEARAVIGRLGVEPEEEAEEEFVDYEGGYLPKGVMSRTRAVFTPCEKPGREPTYESDSGSCYWFDSRGVVRLSSHWGYRVGSCDWFIEGEEPDLARYDARGPRCAYAPWWAFSKR